MESMTYQELDIAVRKLGVKHAQMSVFETVSWPEDENASWIVEVDLDASPFKGPYTLVLPIYGSKKRYSRVMNQDAPTWKDILLAFDSLIVESGDYHHIFLEGLRPGNIGEYNIITGS